MTILPRITRFTPAAPASNPQPLLTRHFAEDMAERLLAAAIKAVGEHPARALLHVHSYFALYARQLSQGAIAPLVEADAPEWLQEALELLEAQVAK